MGLGKHEKGLSDLDHSKIYRQFITKGSVLGQWVTRVTFCNPIAMLLHTTKYAKEFMIVYILMRTYILHVLLTSLLASLVAT